jgi:hypothetical protein
MKSMTVHKIDEQLAESIEQVARERGESLNSTIKALLTQALGLNSEGSGEQKKPRGYRRFLGFWSEADVREFNAATADFERVDEGDWAR